MLGWSGIYLSFKDVIYTFWDTALKDIAAGMHYATYNELMKNGWRMKEIDEMDMLGFLRLRAWGATRDHEKKKPRQRFTDEVWPGG